MLRACLKPPTPEPPWMEASPPPPAGACGAAGGAPAREPNHPSIERAAEETVRPTDGPGRAAPEAEGLMLRCSIACSVTRFVSQ